MALRASALAPEVTHDILQFQRANRMPLLLQPAPATAISVVALRTATTEWQRMWKQDKQCEEEAENEEWIASLATEERC